MSTKSTYARANCRPRVRLMERQRAKRRLLIRSNQVRSLRLEVKSELASLQLIQLWLRRRQDLPIIDQTLQTSISGTIAVSLRHKTRLPDSRWWKAKGHSLAWIRRSKGVQAHAVASQTAWVECWATARHRLNDNLSISRDPVAGRLYSTHSKYRCDCDFHSKVCLSLESSILLSATWTSWVYLRWCR